ncbi:YhdP family protein, partial [Pantoea brenneri]|uniref:YhdP family protein n=1 Tax=Pantoea brenneri TaxID=472694 RepID=UPI0013D8FBD4
VMTHLDTYRNNLLQFVSDRTGVPAHASLLQGQWENFGPILQVRDLSLHLQENGQLTSARIKLALAVWQALLHWRWHCRDLPCWQRHLDSNRPLLDSDKEKNSFRPAQINELFLRQFD